MLLLKCEARRRGSCGFSFCPEYAMPRSPKKPCSCPGCPKLTYGMYCDVHKRLMDSRYNKSLRNKDASAFYHSAEWKHLRQNYLIEHPFCMECWKAGRLTKATVVDHIVPIKQGGPAMDESNLQSLCASCHGSKSIREGSRFGQ